MTLPDIDRKPLYYWCNALGEINVPGTGPTHIGTEDDLPKKAVEIYQGPFQETAWSGKSYVVCFDAEYGIMVTWLYEEEDYPDADTLREELADIIEHIPGSGDYAWYFGKNTDPLGHELFMFFNEDCLGRHNGELGDVIMFYQDTLYALS